MAKSNIISKEKGQSIILIVLSMIGMMVLLVLVLDGGYSLLYRRMAQVAADAGAYAGAQAICTGETNDFARNRAGTYAIDYNEATSATVTITSGVVNVVAFKEFDTFFAPLIGMSNIVVEAEAEAGCFSPGFGEGVLPVAWFCHSSFLFTAPSDSVDCQQERVSVTVAQTFYEDPTYVFTFEDGTTLAAIDKLYAVMDTFGTNDLCKDPPNNTDPNDTRLDCDWDNDGVDDILGDGERDWLDLDGGGGGAKDLRDWINDGFDGILTTHMWLPAQGGEIVNVFINAAVNRLGEVVIVPVFDYICPGGNPEETGCLAVFHDIDNPDPGDIIVSSNSGAVTYYHINAFAAFFITCVQAGKNDGCLGSTDMGGPLDVSLKWIEGYFVEGFVPGVGGKPSDGVDTGLFSIYLIK